MNQKIRIKLKSFDHNLVDKSAEKNRQDRKKYRCNGQRSGAAPDAQADLHGEPFDLREQEGSRAVPTLHFQAYHRHLLFDAEDD